MDETTNELEGSGHHKLLTIPAVADRLMIGKSSVYKLLYRGAPLRVVHIGRSIRIEAKSVDEFIEQLAEQEERLSESWSSLRPVREAVVAPGNPRS